MKKFNLMQIVPSLNSGGVEQGTIDIANYLAKKEQNNLIISSGGKLLTYLNKKYVYHHNLPVNSKNFFKMPFIAKKINKIIQQNNINILHIRSRAPSWLLPYINKKNLKSVSTFHNVYGNQNILKKIYNKQLGNVDKIVAISEYVKNEIINIYKINSNKIKVINRGTDIEFFNSDIKNNKSFKNFIIKKNIDLDRKIILYPGRITDWKGQIEFLNIIEYFKNDLIVFYFVGDNKNSSYYKRFLKEIKRRNLNYNCRILGHLNKEELKMMYQCSDLVVSAPLKPEGFGRTISETLSMKRIVLAYNFGGVKNQLESLDSIYKITPLDHDEMKVKINLILRLQENEIQRLGIIARQHIIKFFSKDFMLRSYNNLYEEILD